MGLSYKELIALLEKNFVNRIDALYDMTYRGEIPLTKFSEQGKIFLDSEESWDGRPLEVWIMGYDTSNLYVRMNEDKMHIELRTYNTEGKGSNLIQALCSIEDIPKETRRMIMEYKLASGS